MSLGSISEDRLRLLMKEMILEAFESRRDLFREVMAEVVEDVLFHEAIKEGMETEIVSPEEVRAVLRGK